MRADLWLWHADGRPYCRIEGWEDRRFDSTPRLWEVLRWPERHLLAVPRPAGFVLVTDAWRNLPSRELLARRFLGARERAAMEEVPPPLQGPWLNGRIALKDAVRDFLWARGHGPLFPIEIEVIAGAHGAVSVQGPVPPDLRVAVAAIEGAAVARVAVGRTVRIQLERAEPGAPMRTEGIEAVVDGGFRVAWSETP